MFETFTVVPSIDLKNGEVVRLLRGLISGFGAFALFCFTLAISLHRLDTASAFALATTLALFTQGGMLAVARGESYVGRPSRAS